MFWKLERRSKIPGLAGLALLLWLCSGPVLANKDVLREYDRKISEKSARLDSIQTELALGRKKLEELRRKEGSYLSRLEQLERNIETAEEYVRELQQRMDSTSLTIGRLRDSLVIANDKLAVRQRQMKTRLRNIYKTGRVSLLQIAFTSENIFDMLRRIRYFQELNKYDRTLIADIDSARTRISAHAAALEKEREQLVALKAVKESEQQSLRAERQSREETLQEVRAEKEAYLAMVRELEAAQAELDLLIQTLARKRRKAKTEYERGLTVAFSKRKGALPWPVSGTVVKKFGRIVHPVYKTVTRSIGIDIEAAKGENVVCVAPGEVEYIGSMRGYGKFVIVNHYGGFITVYAHLDTIAVREGQEIPYGGSIGVVGETGSVSGVKLHFQVRKSEEPLDPAEWLEAKE